MNRIKDVALYVLALTVLMAPAIILGWIGFTLSESLGLSWLGLIVGVTAGLVIFYFSVNKIAAQTAEETEAGITTGDQPTDETQPALTTSDKLPREL